MRVFYLSLQAALLLVTQLGASAQTTPSASSVSASAGSVSQQHWNQAIGPKISPQDRDAYAFVNPDPSLPDVLIIGDSISIGYTPVVRKLLAGKANVFRIPENAAWTTHILQNLDKWFDAVGRQHFKVIVFNSGLHDLVRLVNGQYNANGTTCRIPIPEYKTNLEQIISRLHDHADTLLWAATTVVPPNTSGRRAGDEVSYNQAADEVVTSRQIPIIDLYTISKTDRAIYGNPHDVHYKPAGYQRLGTEVAKQISLHL